MKPFGCFRLGSAAFEKSEVVCLGWQIARVLRSIDAEVPDMVWHAADLNWIGTGGLPRQDRKPVLIGDSDCLIERVTQIFQFLSGVFIAVPKSVDRPIFRSDGLWTDDAEDADLGDCLFEVRAFDSSYISVATSSEVHYQRLKARLSGELSDV